MEERGATLDPVEWQQQRLQVAKRGRPPPLGRRGALPPRRPGGPGLPDSGPLLSAGPFCWTHQPRKPSPGRGRRR